MNDVTKEQWTMATDISQQISKIWDEDAATYDESPVHQCPQRPHEVAAWRATLRRLLPDPPARVLDAGAGTGFISLILADQGYDVTAVDLSGEMLAILKSKADRLGLNVNVVQADVADLRPDQTFDAVVERHLIWTLPEPEAALTAWRKAAPTGRLVLIEGTWNKMSGVPAAQAGARRVIRRIMRPESHQHDEYPAHIVRTLPYAHGLLPAEAVRLVESSPWGPARLERLTNVEWASVSDRGLLGQLLGTIQRWAVIAGS
jgi:2-polyprenyl-3-methyl-5-hydroxy-6-metoxy-1,4-benzoquinol methylase